MAVRRLKLPILHLKMSVIDGWQRVRCSVHYTFPLLTSIRRGLVLAARAQHVILDGSVCPATVPWLVVRQCPTERSIQLPDVCDSEFQTSC